MVLNHKHWTSQDLLFTACRFWCLKIQGGSTVPLGFYKQEGVCLGRHQQNIEGSWGLVGIHKQDVEKRTFGIYKWEVEDILEPTGRK